MAITMQGSWTVSVKSKSAAFPQQFIIAGADTGNGVYVGNPSTPPVFVTGESWSITIQNDPGSGFIDSADRIKFPTISGGQYRFDIESNDAGGDQDFDDLILTCSTPRTLTDFLIYGHVSFYSDPCIFNPCFRLFPVIDSVVALAEAVKNSTLRDAIKKLYPDRVQVPAPRNPGDPPPPLFSPLALPLDESTALPVKQQLEVRLTAEESKAGHGQIDAAERQAVVTSARLLPATTATSLAKSEIDRVAVASIIDRIRLFCESGPLPGVVLRFQEYDRTATELAGGPYTGAGARENLGVCATDINGNYIFRFTRSIVDFINEAFTDTATGENVFVQSAPDLIAQLLDVMAPGGVAYETAPYFNVPLLKRIDICIPESRIGRRPTACQGQHAIQAIGNIFIGAPTIAVPPPGQPNGFGPRVGFSNSLGLEGRITARNVLGPQTRCAAWGGVLDLFACFLDTQQKVKTYTIRFRRLGTTPWQFFSQEYRHPKIANIGIPGYSGELIGPNLTPLHVDGGPAVIVPAYTNIETDASFVFTHRDRKAQINTTVLAVPMPGPVQFWIEGYNAAGFKLADDSVTLYIDNTAPTLDIDDNVTMGSQTLGNCALFKLPQGQPGAPLTVKFKADQAQGFLNSYELFVQKGATGSFTVDPPPPAGAPFRLRSYVHGDDLICSSLRGTFDDPTVNAITGYVTVNLSPTGGAWLDPGQVFCAFSLNLNAVTRVTNGYSVFGSYPATPVLIGIQV